jgi:hypothetical protein
VVVQRLVAKPEHNGKRARVLSFDARTGRYAVALDDGKKLLLKVECVVRADAWCGRMQNQMPELDVEAFSNRLEVVVLFQPGHLGIHVTVTHTSGGYSDGAVVRCVSTAVASYQHAGWPSLPQSMRMAPTVGPIHRARLTSRQGWRWRSPRLAYSHDQRCACPERSQ